MLTPPNSLVLRVFVLRFLRFLFTRSIHSRTHVTCVLVQGRARARPSKYVVFVPTGADLATRIETELRAYTAVEEHLYKRCSAAAPPEQQGRRTSSENNAARQAPVAQAPADADSDTWVYRPREGYGCRRVWLAIDQSVAHLHRFFQSHVR